ncbi:unnamed protein product [Phytophthora fragariaefolia]|uniref:Unnamed protein product n=1 Tax=Phytophthora fragariaefolia TaxID=1490495 RepID=A0A9W6YI01_9STRA|nr:unnamed protein product [Phytophthora fragariaefolia]
MQMSSLAEFQLVPRAVVNATESVVSSQRTETVPSSPASSVTSIATSEAFSSTLVASSQTSTIAPWTPQRGDRTPPPPPLLNLPRVALPSLTSPSRSTPGFEVVDDTALGSARDEWVPDVWPASVVRITEQRSWKFPRVPIGVQGGAGCECSQRCNALSCTNARQSRFCNESFGGVCENALRESSVLAIRRNTRTAMRGLVTTAAIPTGEVIGEYLGHVQLFGPPCQNAPANEGFKMYLKTRTTGNKFVGIDALEKDGLLRLMNHSCNAAARFHEVQTGDKLTVVAVTVRDVYPGEEMTVSYGSKLWFLCRCGWWGCQHRGLQHLAN